MKIISFFIAFCFTFNVLADTGSIREFDRLLDGYHYALTVEWDQKDQSFYEKETKSFFSQLDKLIAEKGITKSEILNLMEKKIVNKEALEAIKLKFSILGKGASLEDYMQIIKDSSSEMYSQGANWNGRVWIPASIALLVIVAIVGYTVWWDDNHDCVEYETQYICRTYNNCNNSTYTTSCYTNYTTCAYEEVCTDYDKK